jgi:hypothetical protein
MAYDGPPIHYAIRGQSTALALQRIRDGADIDLYEPHDGNAVLWAAFMGDYAVLRALVERGAKLNVVHDDEGKTALDFCKEARCYKILKDHGAVHAKGEPVTCATYDLDDLLQGPAADVLRRLEPLLQGVLRTTGEELLYSLMQFLWGVEAMLDQARKENPREAVGQNSVFWGNLDPVLRQLEEIGDAESAGLLRQVLKRMGPDYRFFEEIENERLYSIEAADALEVVRLFQRLLEGRPRLDELRVRYIAAHRDLFEKP